MPAPESKGRGDVARQVNCRRASAGTDLQAHPSAAHSHPVQQYGTAGRGIRGARCAGTSGSRRGGPVREPDGRDILSKFQAAPTIERGERGTRGRIAPCGRKNYTRTGRADAPPPPRERVTGFSLHPRLKGSGHPRPARAALACVYYLILCVLCTADLGAEIRPLRRRSPNQQWPPGTLRQTRQGIP